MYEENPYPRFKFSYYTDSKLAKPIYRSIEIEASKKVLSFSDELKSPAATPNVLIAGCGTGNQIIFASRYKNAQITAIDLSSSSLAYAIRKTNEYQMNNVSFMKMDLLDVSKLEFAFALLNVPVFFTTWSDQMTDYRHSFINLSPVDISSLVFIVKLHARSL